MGKCRGCGKPVVFARDTSGKTQILDPRPPVYAFFQNGIGQMCCTRLDPLKHAVSHFATCPKASSFSRKLSPENAGEEG